MRNEVMILLVITLKGIFNFILWFYYLLSLPMSLVLYKNQGKRYTSLWKLIVSYVLVIVTIAILQVPSLLDLIFLFYILFKSAVCWVKNRRRISRERYKVGKEQHSYFIELPRFFPATSWGMYLTATLPLICAPLFLFSGTMGSVEYCVCVSIFLIIQTFLLFRRRKIQLLDQRDALVNASDLETALRNPEILQVNAIQERLTQLLRKK